jgi:aspartate/methionine/tyrosine aminotransferase
VSNSSLTESEQSVARSQILDLAVGYPQLTGPDWLSALREVNGPRELRAAYQTLFPRITGSSPARTPSLAALEGNLIAVALDFLGLPASLAGNCFVTHSGSTALERAIAVAVPPVGVVRIAAPIFDVIPGFLRERSAVLQWWELDWTQPSWAGAGRALAGTHATILVTPDNPSGIAAGRTDLAALAVEADRAGCVLVADQSLSLLSSDGGRAPLLADVADRRSAWIMLWDTGKTFDLHGDKIGLMIVGDPLKEQVRAALSLVQYSLSVRLMTLMTLVLAEAARYGYLEWLTSARRVSEKILADFGRGVPVDARVPAFGAFALVDSQPADPEMLVRQAAEEGLGLVSTSSFTRGTPLHDRGCPLLRIPLLREPEMMRESLGKLSALLGGAHAGTGVGVAAAPTNPPL